MKDSIMRRMSLCIELKDAFTNKRIEREDLYVYVNGYSPLSKKDGRYYVFPDIEEDNVEIKVKASLYEDRNCRVSFKACRETKTVTFLSGMVLDNRAGFLLISIRLYPNEYYILPAGYKRIVLTGKPMEEVLVIRDRERAYLLAADYQGGEIMEILLPKQMEAAGMQLRILEKNGEGQEDFVILEERKPFQYAISQELKGRYKKGSKIYELYSVCTDEKGKACAVVRE